MTQEENEQIIEFLSSELREASQEYYNGNDIMSDSDFDSKWDFLRTLDPKNPIFSEISKGYKLKDVDEKERFAHPISVGSVDKCKSLEALRKWLKKGATFSTKIDGNSVVAYYRDGKLTEIVTRGSENIGIIRTIKLIKKVAATIPVMGYVAVRGEAAIKRKTYAARKDFNQDKASRSTVSGAIMRKDNWENVIECVDFIAYTFLDCNTEEDLTNACVWDDYFKVEAQKDLSEFNELTLEDFKKKYKDDYEYDADGIVFKNPDGSLLAFKFEDEKGYTDLLDVLWKIGKDQRLTPVAQLKTIKLSGASISKASMGSYARATSIGAWPVREQHAVEIKRANEIIPYVNLIVSKSGSIKNGPVVVCPECGSIAEQDGEHIFCVNSVCPNIERSRLLSFSEFFYPEGLSNTTASKFFDSYRIRTVSELLSFNLPNMKHEIYGIGQSAYNLFNKFLDNTRQDLDVKSIYSTFLKGCGRRASIKIVDSGFDINEYIINPSSEIRKLSLISNFNSNIITDMKKLYDVIKVVVGKRTWLQVKSPVTTGTFCITGARFKPEQMKIINESGWGEDASIKKTTTILVTKDPNSTSAKIEKAKSYGIKVMTIDSFMSHISN